MRFTRQAISRLTLPYGKSEAFFWDDTLPGFGIRLRSGGKRTWIAQYRSPSGQRRQTLGRLDVVGLDAARQHAKEVLAKVQLGSDPQAEKVIAKAKALLTFQATARRYLDGHASKKLKKSTFDDVERYLTSHFETFNDMPLHSVSHAIIASKLGEIANGSGPSAANRARAHLASFFAWAMGEGLVGANPVAETNRAIERGARERILSDQELAHIWLEAMPDTDFGRIVRLLILTGQRREEVSAMAWSELALHKPTKAVWSLPASRTKNGRPHDVPLSPASLAVLDTVLRRNDRDLLFGEGNGPFSGFSKAKSALDRRIAKYRAERLGVAVEKATLPTWTLHDLRRTAATGMASLGVQPHIVEAVLNHISGHRAGVAGAVLHGSGCGRIDPHPVWSQAMRT
jgi:integrase